MITISINQFEQNIDSKYSFLKIQLRKFCDLDQFAFVWLNWQVKFSFYCLTKYKTIAQIQFLTLVPTSEIVKKNFEKRIRNFHLFLLESYNGSI